MIFQWCNSNESFVLLQIVDGPTVNINVSAMVTEPCLHVSSTAVEFGAVQCSQCCVITLQLHNDNMVPCKWSSILQSSQSKSVRI